jgi:hypothetical protein
MAPKSMRKAPIILSKLLLGCKSPKPTVERVVKAK